MSSRKLASSLLSVSMLSACVVVLTPAQAAAATPKCTRQVQMKPRAGYSYYMLIPKSATTVNCYMNRGTQNTGVTALQTALAYCYNVQKGISGGKFGPGDIDGIYGRDTELAVEHLQLQLFPQESSKQDGIYGPVTAASMKFPWHNPTSDRIMDTCTRRDGSS
ncbi:peptidoglycan-binding protein [Streptomyces sp. TRM66268-LWL]|uniref:Peptidoglycan-binding protein n=1 Tax=Streptomyces polyasparticus TaxID=2767826 RepID=A0ABR7SI24_9ACTN|nr:peptidoglycan-binding domain-containing protein [Streptomyces polyasparticus]MBC9715132.1 peptidoglycan-binding protein [Streptomyces polyasparticus]